MHVGSRDHLSVGLGSQKRLGINLAYFGIDNQNDGDFGVQLSFVEHLMSIQGRFETVLFLTLVKAWYLHQSCPLATIDEWGLQLQINHGKQTPKGQLKPLRKSWAGAMSQNPGTVGAINSW